ncbi:LytR/AlgR family response regulator transcription factor [Bifidobacterium aerophilum]|uniref:Response regulator n=1 Tax=Bifidobacterium aerophilum TaxID=1798155 RepID=A0A6N9Z6R7_9BIFI|nr:LytTR family DNA-binding domain-containing protein [Bifidobacterium aerophilum]NEG90054.1 response regulator [Bifidobacterium aerophilum]
MFTVAVVEDDENAAVKLRACLGQYESEHPGVRFEVTVFREPTSFLEPYRANWDIVFMDIEMPNMDGMEAARRLRDLDAETILIFVTNMAQFAAKGYEVDALDYIIKPFSYPDFQRKLSRAVRLCERESDAIAIAQRGVTQRIRLRDISHVEVRGRNLDYHTEGGVITASGSLKELEATLRPHGFVRCGNPYLVNQRYITAVKGQSVLLEGGVELPIGRAYRKQFLTDLAAELGRGHVTSAGATDASSDATNGDGFGAGDTRR